MEKFKKIMYAILYPHISIVILLVPVSAALLTYTFAFGSTERVIAYISYVVSFYALTIVCARSPIVFKGIMRFKRENKYSNMYFSDPALRVKISLYISVTVNTLYAFLQLVSGIYYRSVWFYALSVYYALLVLMRVFLLRDSVKKVLGKELIEEFKRYRFCGIVLLFLNFVLAIILTYIVWQNRGFEYNEIVTIAMAAYTFYTMTMAIINVIRYRKFESPIMSAAKAVSLTAALVSIISLETAMLTAFSNGEGPQFRQLMTALTGAGVSIMVLTIAIMMIVHANKAIRRLNDGGE